MTHDEALDALKAIPEQHRAAVERRLDLTWHLRAIDHAETCIQYAGTDADRMRSLLTELRAAREGRQGRTVGAIREEIDGATAAAPSASPWDAAWVATREIPWIVAAAAARVAAWTAARDATLATEREAADRARCEELARQAGEIERAIPEALTAWAAALDPDGEAWALTVLFGEGVARLSADLQPGPRGGPCRLVEECQAARAKRVAA